ncbi:MAG: T9SS type A sorting domain-containing protein, partial [Candidatus Marinimicrobia bacterium]|nr:T9SS type A sorting domain-containing protein [Candidatus Neomarinimicrobiota bacterium]
ARIPGIDLSLSNDLFNEFQSMGFLNNDQYFTVLDDSIQHLYITNPDAFSVLSTLDISTVRHVLDQIKVITADHSFFADYNERVLEFFSEHSTGPDFWQLEDIPQGYNYLVGSGPEGHVMVAGTNPNGGTPALFYSENDDLSWTPLYGINNPAPMFRDVIISGDGRIYIPDFAYGVFYSDDYGQTWTGSGEFTPDGCAAFGLHPSGVLFAGLASGIGYIHRSADNGSTWEAIPLPDYDSNYAVEHIHFNTQGHVFLGTINGIYRSTDVGASWDQVNDGLNGVQVYSMTIDDQGHIYILTTQPGLFDGYYRSMDNGSTWEALDWVQDINYALDIVAVDGHIYAINDQNIFITIDEGQTWSELTNGLSEEETFNLGADLELTSSGYLYAAGRYVHRSSQPVFSPTMDIKPINVPKIFSFKLFPAYPNPFNPTTTIQFSVEMHRNASLQIFDITGQLVETLVNGQIGSGFHEIKWNAGGFASGVYFVRLQNGNHLINQKLLLLK